MAFFWVNLGGSFEEVIKNSFLWAPKFNYDSNGKQRTDAGWKPMEKVSKGDIFFCYKSKEIVGIAQAIAEIEDDTPRPATREPLAHKLPVVGIKVKIRYQRLIRPIKVSYFEDEFIELHNENSEPQVFTKTGRVGQRYMCALSEDAGNYLYDLVPPKYK